MIERYAGLRYYTEIAVLGLGGLALLTCLGIIIYSAWKDKRRRRDVEARLKREEDNGK